MIQIKKLSITLLSLIMIFTVACRKPEASSTYTLETAKKNGDVISLGEQINTEKLDKFMENIKNGIKDKVRITGFTTEGGVIITDLEYDGRIVKYIRDDTGDGYGSRKIMKKEFKSDSIYKKDKDYYLKDSSGEILLY